MTKIKNIALTLALYAAFAAVTVAPASAIFSMTP